MLPHNEPVTVMNKLRLLLATLLALYIGSGTAAELQGHLDWARRVELSTPVSGTVDQVLVDVGAKVRKGQPLVRLDQRSFKARVSKDQAELASAKDVLEEAKRELDRDQELYERQVMSTHELQLSKIALTEAEANFQRARSQLELAKLDLEYSTIEAPYPAIVLQRRVQPGQTVVSRLQTTPLLVLASSEEMLVRADVSPDELAQLRPGSTVDIRVGGRSYKGKIGNLGLEPKSTDQGPRYPVEVAIPIQKEGELRAGQSATIELP